MNPRLRPMPGTIIAAVLLVVAAMTSSTGRLQRVDDPGDPGIVKVVKSRNLVFVSGLVGKSVEDVVKQADAALKEAGLDVGAMIQHTLYVKEGTPDAIGAISAFHAATRAWAPRLQDKPSTGTILRVPGIGGDNTHMLDLMAAVPGTKTRQDDFVRIWFHPTLDGIVETVSPGRELIFTSGMEAMNFSNGTLAPDLDSQVKYIVEKIHSALARHGLNIGHMIAHNLYVQKGTNTMEVIRLFHKYAQAAAPSLKQNPSVGTLVVVDGMASPGFKLEVDVIAARSRPGELKRVPFPEGSGMTEIAQSVEADGYIFLAGMEGATANTPDDVLEQVEIAVNKVHKTLQASGLGIGSMVKYKLYVRNGEDASAVIRRFHEVATRLAPGLKSRPSAGTLVMVEDLVGLPLKVEISAIAARP
ncbi:MAG: hypothetical protein IT480_02215 [Gammaproteobacteria bacterium]|nr:hypothetical protein [Gammaproteobacteria bacterium]